MQNKKCVILLSGGLDSITCLAIAKDQGFDVHCISFDYGQRHDVELSCAKNIAEHYKTPHKTIKLDLRAFGGSALTDEIEVPKNDNIEQISDAIPITYVPARNTIFLSYALAYAEVIGAFDIFIGVNAVDYSGYPDCRPEYIEAYEKMANKALAATESGTKKLTIHKPLVSLSKADIIKTGINLKVDYSFTSSCYDPQLNNNIIYACGHCDSCLLRKKGFEENGTTDPIHYL